MTLVVNLFAGPGTGKSTNAAAVFAMLKEAGVSAEIVHEFAKDLVWEDRQGPLKFQPYIFGKQAWHVQRLLGQVDVVITDSPILLSSHIYSNLEPIDQFESLASLSEAVFKSWNTLNYMIVRDTKIHPYVEAGRNQTEVEAKIIDKRIEVMLDNLNIEYDIVGCYEPRNIANHIESQLT